MLNQTFSTKNICAILKTNDFITYKIKKTGNEYVDIITSIVDAVNADVYFDTDFVVNTVNGKFVFKSSSLHNTLVLRKLNDNIRRLYKVKQSDRNSIVTKILCIMKDKSPMWVTRLDIKDFYESIDRSKIVSKLCSDSLLSFQSKNILIGSFVN